MSRLLFKRNYPRLDQLRISKKELLIDFPLILEGDKNLEIELKSSSKKPNWRIAGNLFIAYPTAIKSQPITINFGRFIYPINPIVDPNLINNSYRLKFRPNDWIKDFSISIFDNSLNYDNETLFSP